MAWYYRTGLALGAICLGAFAAAAGDTATKPTARNSARQNESLAPIQDVAGLPRVLLLGDSISMGYTLPAREALSAKANVHRPQANCRSTQDGVQRLESWLGDGRWDVIHFNFGLHDLRYVDAKGQNASPEDGYLNVSEADYERNLETIVLRLKKTGAKLIFATTTPVPADAQSRRKGDEQKYNAIALTVMKKHGIAIDDLHALAERHVSELQRPANVHFTEKGYRQLAQQVAASVLKALESEKRQERQ